MPVVAPWGALMLVLGACTSKGDAEGGDADPTGTTDVTEGDTDTTDIVNPPGDSSDTGVATSAALVWVEAHAGALMSCGLASDGSVRCWGWPECTDQAPALDVDFDQIDVGIAQACGITAAGTVRCWCCDVGYYLVGENICPEVPPGQFTRVLVGQSTACAQDAAGVLTCWGDDWSQGNDRVPPVEPVSDFAMESSYNMAILLDGTIDTWGNGAEWDEGPPPSGVSLVDVGAGRSHACGLDAAGALSCWGHDGLGNPFPSPPPGVFAQVESYSFTSCAIDAAGALTCWWVMGFEEGDYWDAQFPTVPMAQVGLGEFAGCGVSLDGDAICWGEDPAYASWLRVPDLNP